MQLRRDGRRTSGAACRGNYELHGSKLHRVRTRDKKNRKKAEHVRVPDVRRIDVLMKCHERGITLVRENERERELEKERLRETRKRGEQDARTRKKAKQLLWDSWPLRDKKFRRTESRCHPSSNILARERCASFRAYRGEILKYSEASTFTLGRPLVRALICITVK